MLGAIRLPEREHPIDYDHAEDRKSERSHALPWITPLGEERKRHGDPQNDRKEMHKLLGKRRQQRLMRDFFHLVRAELRETSLRLGVAQPREPALQAGKGVGDGELVDLHDNACIGQNP